VLALYDTRLQGRPPCRDSTEASAKVRGPKATHSSHVQVGHTLGTYNLAMLQLSRDASSCPHALELLKKVAGALACCRLEHLCDVVKHGNRRFTAGATRNAVKLSDAAGSLHSLKQLGHRSVRRQRARCFSL